MFDLTPLLHIHTLSVIATDINVPTLVIELVLFFCMLVAFFLFRHRMIKTFCVFGAEICLWLSCRMAFGKEFILSQIMNWITALAVLGLTIAIVNRINWGSLRGENKNQ